MTDHHDEPRPPIPERDEYWAQFNDDVAYVREHVEAMCRVKHSSSRCELANEALRTLAVLRPADTLRPEDEERMAELETTIVAYQARAALGGLADTPRPEQSLRSLAQWLVSLDEPDSAERRTVTLTAIINAARAALSDHGSEDR